MKIRKICDIVILITGILAVLSLGIAFSQNRTLGDMVENIVSDMLEDSVQVTEQKNEVKSMLSELLLGDVGDVTKMLGDKIQDSMSGLLMIYKAGLFIPSFLAVTSAVLIWVLQREWRYLAGFGTALLGLLVLLGSELLVVPFCLYQYIKDSGILNWVGDIVKVTDLSKVIINAVGMFYWIGMGLLLVLTIMCIVGFFAKDKEAVSGNADTVIKETGDTEDTPPVIRGIAGMYAGGVIPVESGEVLIMGHDSKVCNLILEGEGVSERHCSVEFDKENNQYLVRDFSDAGTYTNDNIRLKKGEYQVLERNSLLVLGSDENIFMLE